MRMRRCYIRTRCSKSSPVPRRFKSALRSIKEFGKGLRSIKIFVENKPSDRIGYRYCTDTMIFDIIEGCPKLKTLTLEPLKVGSDLFIEKDCLETLSEGGMELETLRIIKGHFSDLFDEKEVKEILPNCNVEMAECSFKIPVRNKLHGGVRIYMVDSSDTD